MSVTPRSRRMAAAAVGGVLTVGLVACSSDPLADDAASDTESTPVAEADEDTGGAEVIEDGDDAQVIEDAGDGAAAAWAEPVTTPGKQIATIDGDSFQVEVYQVDITASPKDGRLADPDTNEAVLAEGDDIVFVNYVVTNVSDRTLTLSSSLIDIDVTYADWEYLQGMDSITDRDLFAAMEVNESAVAERLDPPIYPLEPGQVISYGTNFMYKVDVPLLFEATLSPVDDQGDTITDEREEASAEATLT